MLKLPGFWGLVEQHSTEGWKKKACHNPYTDISNTALDDIVIAIKQ